MDTGISTTQTALPQSCVFPVDFHRFIESSDWDEKILEKEILFDCCCRGVLWFGTIFLVSLFFRFLMA